MDTGSLGKVPLYRALSKLGIASRTQTRTWIEAGEIKINGTVCRDPEQLVTPEKDSIIHGEKIAERAPLHVIMLNKPKSVITTRSDEQGRPTVYTLLPQEFHSLHSVGRLDWASTGLLLFTNNTKLSSWLTDPVNHIPRTYVVTAKGLVTEETIKVMMTGIINEGQNLVANNVILRKSSKRESHLIVTLTEGKNREIRRLCKSFGHEVTKLKRVSFGGLELGDLAPGTFREVSVEEIPKAFAGVQRIIPTS
jgi:23S rRNA pseudouridine2605 synthase